MDNAFSGIGGNCGTWPMLLGAGDASLLEEYGPLAAILALIAASVWMGTVAQKVVSRGGSFMQGYFLGNRGLGSWALALTATVQSGGTFMGFPSLVYTNGWVVALWIGSYMVVPLTGFSILAKRFAQLSRRTSALTVPDLFRERFQSPAVGLAASLIILFSMLFMMVAQYKAGAIVIKVCWPGGGAISLSDDMRPFVLQPESLEAITVLRDSENTPGDAHDTARPIPAAIAEKLRPLLGQGFDSERDFTAQVSERLSPDEFAIHRQRLVEAARQADHLFHIGLVLFTVTVVAYSLIGGFLAAVWTDLFQSVIMWIGVMILLPLSLIAAGGLPAATQQIRWEMNASDGKLKPEEKVAVFAAREPAAETLHELDRTLRAYASTHDGRLPDSLRGLESQIAGLSGDPSRSLSVDPLTGQELYYFGAGRSIDPVDHPQRVLIALTPSRGEGPKGEKGIQTQWQTALYSNGVIRNAVFSKPGALVTGPGPNNYLPWGLALSFFFVWVVNGLGSPAGMVRVMASSDTPTIRKSILLLASYNLCIYVPLVMICICGRAIVPELGSASDEIVPRMALLTTKNLLGGPLLTGLILAAPFGAVMATVSAYLVVIASGMVRDIYQRFVNPGATQSELRRMSYVCMIVVGAIGVVANWNPIEFLQALVVFSGTCGATAFLVPAVMAAFWRRATAQGTLAAMLIGFGCTLTLYAMNWIKGVFTPVQPCGIDPVIWGLALSLISGVGISWLTSPPEESVIRRLFDVSGEAGKRGS